MSKRTISIAARLILAALAPAPTLTTPAFAATRLHAPQIIRIPTPSVTALDLAAGDVEGNNSPEIGMYGSDGKLHVFQFVNGGWNEVHVSAATNQYPGLTPTVRFTSDPGMAPGSSFHPGQFLFNTLTFPEEHSIISVRRETGGAWSDEPLYNYMTNIPLTGAFSAPGELTTYPSLTATRIAVMGGFYFDPVYRLYLPGPGSVSGPHPVMSHGLGGGGYCDQVFGITGAVIGDFYAEGTNAVAIAADVAPGPVNQLWVGYTDSASPSNTTGCTAWTRFSMPVTGDYPVQIEVGNFDGNSATDLVVRYSTGQLVTARGHVGVASFTIAPITSQAGTVTDMLVADVNGDGLSDIVRSFSSPAGYEVLMNDGTGAFTSNFHSTAAFGGAVSSVAMADFDGDSMMDLLLGQPSAEHSRLLIMPGSGMGQTTPPAVYSVGSLDPTAVAVGFFDADADLDVAVGGTDTDLGDGNQPLAVLTNELIAGFGTPSTSTAAFFTPAVHRVTPFRPQVGLPTSLGCYGPGFRGVAAGNGDGTLQGFTPFYSSERFSGQAFLDFDGIGDLDDVWLQSDGDTASAVLFEFSGSFLYYPLPDVHDGLAVVDWNDDGALDIVTLNRSNSELSVLLQDPATPRSFIGFATYPVSIPIGPDPAGDGRPFVLLPRTSGFSNYVAVRSGDYETTREVEIFSSAVPGPIASFDLTQSATGFVSGFAAGDVDGDDLSDILLGELVGSHTHLSLLHGMPSGGFAAAGAFLFLDHRVTSMAVGDITGDGFGDLVMSTGSGLIAAAQDARTSSLGVSSPTGMAAIPAVASYSSTESVGDRPRPASGPGSLRFSITPNPSRGTATRVAYTLAEAGPVSAELFDLSGRRVRSLAQGQKPAGTYRDALELRDADGQSLKAGVYFVRLQAGREHGTRRVVVLP